MLGTLRAGFLPAAAPENPLVCSMALCALPRALWSKELVARGFCCFREPVMLGAGHASLQRQEPRWWGRSRGFQCTRWSKFQPSFQQS